MYSAKSIVEFLMSGVTRLPPDGRAEALCSMFGGLLPNLSETEVMAVRGEMIARFWHLKPSVEPIVDLIDGHLALRILLAEISAEAGGNVAGDYGNAENDFEL